MIIRKLSEKQYQKMLDYLNADAAKEDFSAACDMVMAVDGMCYRLRLQPERHRKLVILQAVSWPQKEPAQRELVTDGAVLSSLLELLIHQICSRTN